MACEKCEEVQDDHMEAYYRWKNANILIVGCKEHLLEIFNALNEAQKKQ